METVVKGEGIYFSYDLDKIFSNVNFEVKKNEFLGIIGPNGGGKSTLIKLILGFLKPNAGSIRINDGINMSYVPQNTNSNVNFPILAIEVVTMGFLNTNLFKSRDKRSIRNQSMQILERLGISDIAEKKIGDLSGGQRQKILIARSLVSSPDILFLDEPTSNLDVNSQNEVYKLLKKLSEDHTIVSVGHDVTMLLKYATRILHINKDIISHGVPAINVDDNSHQCEIDILESFINT